MNFSELKKSVLPPEVIETNQVIFPIITFVLGSLLSLSIFLLVLDWEESELKNLFSINAQARLSTLKTDIIRHQEIVNSVASLFSSSSDISRKEFQDFVKNALSSQSGIQALSWIPLIKSADLNSYKALAQQTGFTDFEITQLNVNNQMTRTQIKDEYLPVYYIEPYIGNEKAMGFDLSSHPGRLAAINKARDTGEAVITERIKLVQEQEQRFGYLLFKAVYKRGTPISTVEQRRENFIGLSSGVFNFAELLDYTNKSQPPSGMDILILDQSAEADKQFLHFHSSRTRKPLLNTNPQAPETLKSGIHWQTTINILERDWSFLFSPAPAFIKKHKEWQAWLILFAGLVISILLSLYIFTKNQHILRFAKTNARLEKEFTEHQSQRKFTDTVLNAASDVVVVLDMYGRIVRFNRTAEELTGYKSNELLGQFIWKWLIPDDQINAVESVFNNLRIGNLDIARHYENEWVMRDKTRRLFQWHNSLLFDDNGDVSHIVAMGFDITEMKKAESEHERLQRELQQAQKMESLGQLTGGIAHDFNNLLGIINGYSVLLLDKSQQAGDDKASKYARNIHEAGERAAKLVAQMLTFSRNDNLDDKPIQFAPLIEENIEMLRATLPSSIEIKTEIEADLPYVLMNPTNLHQILMNLFINARDAMQGVGQVTIKLALARGLDTQSQISHKPVKGDWVELSVSDTGKGIDAELIKHIFEPFFTTKDIGKGTGMGLSVLYGIMKSHGGHILVESEPGKGTTISMLFAPTTKDNLNQQEDCLNLPEPAKSNGERILVVDDEISLGNYMTELLANHGYDACFVADSTEALSLFESAPDQFAMLVTDLTMPKLTGEVLIKKVRKIRPQLPVILCTGYNDKFNKAQAHEMNISYFEKPVNVKNILLKISELLNK